jgi:hypothetical protein
MVQVTQCGWVDPIVGDVQIVEERARFREELDLQVIHVTIAAGRAALFDWVGPIPLERVLHATDQDEVRSRRRLDGLQAFQRFGWQKNCKN